MDNNRTYYSNLAEVHAARQHTALIVFALAVGVGFGAVAGLMFAPNSGRKTREGLTSSFEHSLEHGASKGHEMVDPTVKRLEKELAELRKSVESKIDERRKA